jgi:hypothetical protein
MAGFWAEAGRVWWIAHGTLMILSWGFFIPLGTLLAVYRRHVGPNGKILKKEPSFYPWHRNLQMFGFILAMIGFGMGAIGSKRVYTTGRAFDYVLLRYWNAAMPWNRHVKLGVTVLIIAGAQVLLGIIAHIMKDRHSAKPDAGPWKRPLVPSWLHVVMGVCNVLLAYVTIYQGLQIYDFIFYKLEHSPGIKAGYALVSISGFLFLVFYMYEKTMIIFCGAGVPKKEDTEKEEKVMDAMESVPVMEEALPVKDPGTLEDHEGAA